MTDFSAVSVLAQWLGPPADLILCSLAAMLLSALLAVFSFILIAVRTKHYRGQFAALASMVIGVANPLLWAIYVGGLTGLGYGIQLLPAALGAVAFITSCVCRERHAWWRCQKCGYDLRGNRSAQTCPECGQVLISPQSSYWPP